MLVSAAVALWPAGLAAQETPSYLSWATPGPYRAPEYADFALNTFRSDQPIVGTYFFYWFDADTLHASGERFPFNPVDDQTQSFLSRFTVAEVGPGFTSFDQRGPNAVDMPLFKGVAP
jgi:hypothetical protein